MRSQRPGSKIWGQTSWSQPWSQGCLVAVSKGRETLVSASHLSAYPPVSASLSWFTRLLERVSGWLKGPKKMNEKYASLDMPCNKTCTWNFQPGLTSMGKHSRLNMSKKKLKSVMGNPTHASSAYKPLFFYTSSQQWYQSGIILISYRSDLSLLSERSVRDIGHVSRPALDASLLC